MIASDGEGHPLSDRCIVASHSRRLIEDGRRAVRRLRPVIADGRHATIINVFTEPQWRRQGVALLLLQGIIDWARTERLDRLVLHASDAGRALYERLGFVGTNEMRLAGH